MSGREKALNAIEAVAKALGSELCDRLVFVGGVVTAIYSRDGVAVDVRVTNDVDCIVEVHSVGAYYDLTLLLRARGFREDDAPGAPRCRFISGIRTLDVMPTDPSVLGYSNRWFTDAIQTAEHCTLGSTRVRVVTPIYFVATKLVAFAGRGKGDFLASHDLEDAIAVLDAMPMLREAIVSGQDPVHRFLRETLRDFLARDAFRDSVLGHLAGSEMRADRLFAWLGALPR